MTKTQRFEVRLEADLVEALDRWRAAQSSRPSRAEAMRALVARGIGYRRWPETMEGGPHAA